MLLVRVTMGESQDDVGAEILVRRWRWQLDGWNPHDRATFLAVR